jgi:hypothetical protein
MSDRLVITHTAKRRETIQITRMNVYGDEKPTASQWIVLKYRQFCRL